MGDDGTGINRCNLSWKHCKRLSVIEKWRKKGVTNVETLNRIADKVLRNIGYR